MTRTSIDSNRASTDSAIERPLLALERYATSPFDLHAFREQMNACGVGEISEIPNRACRQETFLGEGRNARVYEVPGAPNYALRVPKKFSRLSMKRGVKALLDPAPALNLGQAVAQIDNVYLIKKVPGVVPVPHDTSEMQLKSATSVRDRASNFLVQLPEESLLALCAVVNHANKIGFFLDYQNPGNILYDANTQTLTPIDLRLKSPDSSDMHTGGFNTINQLGLLMFGFDPFSETSSHSDAGFVRLGHCGRAGGLSFG